MTVWRPALTRYGSTSSVGDRSLFARVDVGALTGLEEKRRHVARQECAGLRIHHVEPVMIDQHRLLLTPVRPALPADLGDNPSSNSTRKGSLFESFACLPAPRAGNGRHEKL